VIYHFERHSLDTETRELRRENTLVDLEPQVFDLLQFLIRNRARVVSKDDLVAQVWKGRIVSDSTLSSRVTAVRQAVGDSGKDQRLIRTFARKGLRFVGDVREQAESAASGAAKFVPGASAGEARPSSSKGAGPDAAERRQLTIVACEVVEAAALATHLDPEDLRDVMSRCLAILEGSIERHGGRVAHGTDRGVLGYFGYPQAHEDDAERAVRAGLEMVRLIGALQFEGSLDRLHARVGIATGVVVVGNLNGSAEATERGVIGESPQLATRLQASGVPGTVTIAASTRRLVGELFEYETLGALGVDGSTAPIERTRVLRERAIASRFEALRSWQTPLVGRDEEIELLLRRWRQIDIDEGRVILVWGEPGIGKSRLVAAFQEAIGTEAHACLRYFCSPHRTQTALSPLIAQLEHAAGFLPGDGDGAKLDKLERLMAMSSQDLGRDVALVADLLSVPTGDRYPALSLSPQRRKELLLESFVAQIAGLAKEAPVLIVLEDAHWIDPSTREFFDALVDRMRTLRAMLIITYRPEFAPPWLGEAHVTAMTLARLHRRDNATLVKLVASGRDLPAAVLEQITARSDGVPLFIEELTKSVLESGILLERGSTDVPASNRPAPAVPSTLQASLAARLDRLAPIRALVHASAALGREFSYEQLKAVTELPDADLESSLDRLVASELVHQRGVVPNAIYAFKHALVQDAAYGTMLREQRVSIHRRIVGVLERVFPETPARYPDVLAYHCASAALWEKAIDYSIAAARMALIRSAGAEAHAQVRGAMALLPNIAAAPTRRQYEGRLQVALANALIMTKGFASPDVATSLSSARGLLDDTTHPIESLEALCGLFNYHLIRSESPLCLALAEPFLRRGPDRLAATVGHYLVGTAHLHIGSFNQCIGHLETALSLYDEDACRPVAFVGGYHLRSFTLIWLGLGYLYVGRLKRAAETVAAAVADARSRSHPFTLVSALLALARYCNHMHDLPGAIEATEEGIAIAAEQRSPYHLSRAGILRAVNAVDGGRPEQGIALMESALTAHRATGANFQSSYNLSRLAEAHSRAGSLDRALDLAAAAIADVERTGERWWEAEAQRVRGEILLTASSANRGEAEACYVRALECARRQQAKLWELHAAQSLAGMWAAEGRSREAGALLTPIVDAFSAGPDVANVRSARQMLVQLASAAPVEPRAT